MAQRLVVELEDDLDGEPADETVTFAMDGVVYEIDLTTEHAGQLRSVFEKYVKFARPVAARDRLAVVRDTTTAPDPTAVRRWAQARGITVSPRGRIPATVVEQFQAAGN